MDIQKDAGELLAFLYNQYTQNVRWIRRAQIEEETKWETGRINRVIDYLEDLDLIKIEKYIGGAGSPSYGFGIQGLTPQGIDIIENKTKFKSTFGFEIGIPGIFKFSWKGEMKRK